MLRTAVMVVTMVLFAASNDTMKAHPTFETCGLDIVQGELGKEKEFDEEILKGMDPPDPSIAQAKFYQDDTSVIAPQAKGLGLSQTETGGKTKRAIALESDGKKTQFWDADKPIPYRIQDTTTAAVPDRLRKKIENSIKLIKSYTCIDFKVREKDDKETFYINFILSANGKQQSYVGKQEKDWNSNGVKRKHQTVFLVRSSDEEAILHEILHAFGFIHEQSRPDRDKYIEVIKENIAQNPIEKIQKATEGNFDKMKEGTVNTFGEDYDFNSIMHYPKNNFGQRFKVFMKMRTLRATEAYGGESRQLGPRGSFTASDVVRLNKLFNCKMPTVDAIKKAKEKKIDDDKGKKNDTPGGVCEAFRQIHDGK